jgi:hypothetical protein
MEVGVVVKHEAESTMTIVERERKKGKKERLPCLLA